VLVGANIIYHPGSTAYLQRTRRDIGLTTALQNGTLRVLLAVLGSYRSPSLLKRVDLDPSSEPLV
jgi:hypothetical protein